MLSSAALAERGHLFKSGAEQKGIDWFFALGVVAKR